ncbi:hypothetical protein ACQKIE_18585 [Luteibacter sp. NPDC031894]|uniref:hypothetical protein n=1 Tax=Luteibacter sp. NPDC031894 TaxID=3390572 RepID=UPI003D05CF56
MHKQIGKAAALEPRFKSTASGHFAAGLSIPRPRRDASVIVGFLAGVVLTVVVFMAAAQIAPH